MRAKAPVRWNPLSDGGGFWGLHLADVNIALGNLIEIVRAQSRAHLAQADRRPAQP